MRIFIFTFMTFLMVLTQNCMRVDVDFESGAPLTSPPTTSIDTPTNPIVGGGEAPTPPVEITPPTPIPEVEVPPELERICDRYQRVTKKIKFASTLNLKDLRCQWGGKGMYNGKIAGFLTEVQMINLPEGAHLCGLSLSTPESKTPPSLRYDDHFAITLNGAILVSDLTAFVLNYETLHQRPVFERDGPLILFDRNRIQYFPHPSDANSRNYKYCLGSDLTETVCEFPMTEKAGKFSVRIHPDLVKLAGMRANPSHSQILELHMTGDDDPTKDCRHSDLELELNIDFAL